MAQVLPGTTLPLPEEAADNAFSVLTPIFAVSGGGLLLSQLTEMTGLSPTTIQNNMVCAGLFAMERERTIHHEFVITLIGAQLEGYEGPVLGAKERLSDALAVMLLNIAAATLMQQADAIYEQMCPMR